MRRLEILYFVTVMSPESLGGGASPVVVSVTVVGNCEVVDMTVVEDISSSSSYKNEDI